MLHRKFYRYCAITALCWSASLALTACQTYAPPGLPSVAREILRNAASETQSQAQSDTAAHTPTAEQAPAEQTPAARASAAPVALTIPAIQLGAEVTPMGWELAMNGDVVTTRWVVPLDTLGWAINSAEAGAPGNVVIAGHQALGSALFRSLALGEIKPGQEIRVQAADGVTYLYQVSEVSPPIQAIGATAEEIARSAAYLAPSTDAILTLVAGWPADTTTHRLFVVAEYTGTAP